jgi:uncharacterized protein (DUF2141 family)
MGDDPSSCLTNDMKPKRATIPFASLAVFAAILLLIGSPGFGVLGIAQSDRMGTLVIRITGLSSGKAPLRIAVFNSEESWLHDASAVYKTVLDGESREPEWRIQSVPYGEYAVAVFQDENRDGKLNRNFLGIPREPYGFSSNARGSFGPAKWEDAKFVVTTATTELEMKVR